MKKLVLLPIIICICLLGNSLLASTDTLSESELIALQAKSDSLFAEGVDLYKAKKYQDAIPLFTEADHIDKAILDSTSNRRDYSSMWLASCFYRLGDSTLAQKTAPHYYKFEPIDRRLTIESDSLAAIGFEYFEQENYLLTLDYFQKTATIRRRVMDENHIWYGHSIRNISLCYYMLSDTINSINYYKKYADVVKLNYGKYSANYVEALNEYVDLLYYFKDYENALEQAEYAYSIINIVGQDNLQQYSPQDIVWLSNQVGLSLNGEEEREYYRKSLYYLEYCPTDSSNIEFRRTLVVNIAISYSNEAYENYKKGNYVEAVRLEREALEIRERVLGKEHPDYATTLNNLADYNCDLGNYSEAVELGTEALEIRERVVGKEHPDYAMSLSNLASYNCDLGNYVEAVRLGTEALEIFERVLGKEHPDYATSLSNLANYNSKIQNYTEAVRLGTEALEIRERVLGKEHPDYATSLSNLASYNCDLGNYSEAVRLGTEALEIRERVLEKGHPDYATSLSNLAYYNSEIGNYSEAVKLGTEALEIFERVFGKEHPDYATSLSNLANYNSKIGNYTEAVRLGTEALEIRERVLRKEHPDYARSLNNLANYNSKIGNYVEAVRLGTEALEIFERVLGKGHPNYATPLSNLAKYNCDLGNYSEAVRLGIEALEIDECVLGKNHPNYAISLNNLAYYNFLIGNYVEAVRLGTEALEIRERVLGKGHPDYAISLSNLAYYNCDLENYSEAVKLGTEALEIRERVLGKEHPDYITTLENLAWCTFSENNPDVNKYVREATEGNMAYIRKMFGGMTGYERANFWRTKEYWFNHVLPNFAYGMGTDTLVECAVNGALMSKGLLLNSEIEMTRLLQESGDEAALAKYQELRLNRLQLNKLYEKPIAERPLDTDSLEAVVDRLERELVAQSKAYGDYTRNLVIDWRQVQAELGERDAAVEFVRFALMESDSVMYAAYVTRPGYAVPRMIPLFEARELERLEDFEYEDERLSELVWKPLAEVLSGVDRVYFAPAGELYNMAIESAPDWEDPERLMSDRWDLYRLSSTRELAVTYDDRTASSASVYGGIDYDRAERGKSKDERGREDGEMLLSGTRAWLADSLGLRAGVKPLPGTRVEAESVDRSLRGRRVASELLTDSLGSEWSIKALSGLRKGLLHIATHGFYYSEEEIQEMGSHNFLRLEGMQGARYVEDKALTRSGLLMAGANSALKGEAPEGENDGILTAKEISQLDLRGMDLVVLSACQTGLGEVTGDGVFGLQRGFKKAGARSLLMSLWKVDDKATQLLMERFYDNLTAGMSKHEALLNAQRYVREYEVPIDTKSGRRETTNGRRMALPVGLKMHPYSNPKYWAGFVLLDGE